MQNNYRPMKIILSLSIDLSMLNHSMFKQSTAYVPVSYIHILMRSLVL